MAFCHRNIVFGPLAVTTKTMVYSFIFWIIIFLFYFALGHFFKIESCFRRFFGSINFLLKVGQIFFEACLHLIFFSLLHVDRLVASRNLLLSDRIANFMLIFPILSEKVNQRKFNMASWRKFYFWDFKSSFSLFAALSPCGHC